MFTTEVIADFLPVAVFTLAYSGKHCDVIQNYVVTVLFKTIQDERKKHP